MLLRLHLPTSGDTVDEVAVHAHPSSTLAEVFGLLGRRADTPLAVGGCAVDARSVLGRAPLVDGAVIDAGDPRPEKPRGAACLHVVAGPDAGTVHDLTTGRHVLGRADDCDVRVADAHVSRRHACITLDGRGATVADLASTNGTRIGDAAITDARAVGPGERISLGRTVVALRREPTERAPLRELGDGTFAVNRSPRSVVDDDPVVIDVPAEPSAPDEPGAPVLMIVLPLVVSVTAAIALRSPLFLLFGLMAPALAVGQYVSERRRRRATHETALAAHADVLRRAADDVARAAARELDRRRLRCPDLARVLEVANDRSKPLWARRRGEADHLLVGLGHGVVTADCAVRPVGATLRHPRLDAAPVTLRLDEAGVLGLSGPRATVLALAHAVIGQIAVWTSPREVGVWLLTSRPSALADWRWVTALPHSRGADADQTLVRCAVVGEDDTQLRRRVDSLRQRVHAATQGRDVPDARSGLHVVVVDSGPRLRAVPGVADILEAGPEAGVYAVCLAERPGDLPVECRATATVGTDGELTVSGPAFSAVRDARADLAAAEWGPTIGRALAPLRDPGPAGEGDLPDSVDLLDVLDVDATRADELTASWSRRPRELRAPVGMAADGVHCLDLAQDGPHILVGGMTGSGKSELLRTLVTSLAVLNRPDELSFVLVDYKGGAAFSDCARLPHVLGLVTDLDAGHAGRALRSLRAELRRREKAFAAAGVSDHEAYAEHRDHRDLPALPRLVIVVDEFRALAEEHPDFITGLVRIATLGRSLGVHLVLATQRPTGIVSSEIKANANLRIALRVRDRGDSYDVIESDDAAALPAHLPGRAMLRTGGGELRLVQVARVDTPGRGRRPVTSVEVLDLRALGDPPPAVRHIVSDTGATLPQIVAATRAARDRLDVADVPAPWLPALPTNIDVDSLEDAAPLAPTPGCGTTAWVTFGVVDDPDGQCRRPLRMDLRTGGHLTLVGGGRTGRTTALRTLATLVARNACPAAVHVHVIDAAGALADLAARRAHGELDHLGTYVTTADTGRLRRLLSSLLADIRRRESPGAAGTGATPDSAAPNDPAQPAPPVVLVLVDGWERLRETLEGDDHGEGLRDWLEILRAGPSVGVRCIVTGGRGLLSGTIASLMSQRLLLHLPDPADALLAGLKVGHAPPDLPGRARRNGDGLEVQLAVATPTPTVDRSHAACCRTTSRRAPLVLHPLPSSLTRSDVRHRVRATTPPALRRPSLLGVSADHLSPVYAELVDGLLVVGPRGSGRTTALHSLIDGADDVETIIWVTATGARAAQVTGAPAGVAQRGEGGHHPPTAAGYAAPHLGPPPMTLRPRVVPVDPHDPEALERALADTGRVIVVGDDVERWWDTPVEEALADAVRRRSMPVIVAGTTRDVAARYRGLTANLRRVGSGLVLHPSAADRDVFDVDLPTGEATLPGRAVLLGQQGTTIVQIATGATSHHGPSDHAVR